MGNGKGDKPRNCFIRKFKDNYDAINWGRKDKPEPWKEFSDKFHKELDKIEDNNGKGLDQEAHPQVKRC